MRKFISAVTSLAITATALTGTMMFGASAADTTILEFRSGDSNSVTVASADVAAGEVKVPVKLYVPQSTGVNVLSLKMAINGDETVGQYEEHLFGNYGIKIANNKFSDPNCFDGGTLNDGASAGYADWVGPIFTAQYYNINFTHNDAVQENINLDAFAPYEADGESGVFTWDESVSWAYKYAFAEFDLVLPKGLADGEYVLDIFKGDYVNAVSIGSGKLEYGSTKVSGIDGNVDYITRPLTITVGDGQTQNTTSSSTTTSTTPKQDDPPAGDGIVYKFNTVEVEPGAEATIELTVSGDTGTAGMTLYFAYDENLEFGK